MAGMAEADRTVVAIKSEETLWRTQQTTIDIALPIEFRRSTARRVQSAILPLFVAAIAFAVLAFDFSEDYNPSFDFETYYRNLPAYILLLAAGAVITFFFFHRIMNWLTNLAVDCRGGAVIAIDSQGLTDRRIARQQIRWADVAEVDIIRVRGCIDEVELALKDGSRFRPRKSRFDLRIYNAVARGAKGPLVTIDVKHFDADAHTIASVIEALAKKPDVTATALSSPPTRSP